MRRIRLTLGGLACLLVLTTAARADAPPDPLRLIPDDTYVLVEVPRARQLVEAVGSLDALQQLRQFSAVQEFLQSQNARRFTQLLGYYEKELGTSWPELLDRLAGGGIALGVKYADGKAPALLVIQSKDEALLRKFARLGLEVLEQVSQQDSNDKIQKAEYRGVETIRLGPELQLAVVGGALVVSNEPDGLKKAIDLHKDGGKSLAGAATVAESRKLLPPNPLARLWVNMETVHDLPGARTEVFSLPRNNVFGTVLFGGVLDVAGRSPFLAAGLYGTKDGFLFTVRMPRGRQGLNEAMAVHVPPDGQSGTRPLLEPKGVMYSSSFYLDVGRFWEDRAKLFTPEQVKAFEDGEKNTGRFLAGHKLSDLLKLAGSYHRFVAAHQVKPGYDKAPGQAIPAFAFILEPRDTKEFAKAMNTVLRGAALLAGFQTRIKLVEEKRHDYEIVGYRFPEDGTFPGDTQNLRFNFSPCYVATGRHFVFCSTIELGRELVDLLDAEEKGKEPKGTAAVVRTQLYSAGGAEFLKGIEDILRTQVVLGQAVEPDVARSEVRELIEWVRRLGVIRTDWVYGPNEWHYDVRFVLGK